MDPHDDFGLALTRRHFFARTSTGIGIAALASLMDARLFADNAAIDPQTGGLAGLPHFAPKAKRVIYLHQSGARTISSISSCSASSWRCSSHTASRQARSALGQRASKVE